MNEKIFRALLSFLLLSLPVRAEEIALKREIAAQEAQNQIKRFFIARLNSVVELDRTCDQVAGKLARELASVQISAKADTDPLAQLTNAMVRESALRMTISHRIAELEKIQKLFKNLIAQLSLLPEQLMIVAGPPDISYFDYGYRESVERAYSESVSRYGPTIRLGASPCLSQNVDVRNLLNQRRDYLNRVVEDFTKKYVADYRAKIERAFEDAALPSETLNTALQVRKTLFELDTAYRSATTQSLDYFSALEILRAYEDVSSVILGTLVSKEARPEVRKAAESEINHKLQSARKALNDLKDHPPSAWLRERHHRLTARIQRGEFACAQKCRSDLKESEVLIGAASLMEDVVSSQTHAILASELLGRVEKGL